MQVRIISYDKSKKRLSLSMKEWTEPVVKDETDEIKSYVDPVPEGTKTAFAMAWAVRVRARAFASASFFVCVSSGTGQNL